MASLCYFYIDTRNFTYIKRINKQIRSAVFLHGTTQTSERKEHEDAKQIENTIETFLELLSFSVEQKHHFFPYFVCVCARIFVVTFGLFPFVYVKGVFSFQYSLKNKQVRALYPVPFSRSAFTAHAQHLLLHASSAFYESIILNFSSLPEAATTGNDKMKSDDEEMSY